MLTTKCAQKQIPRQPSPPFTPKKSTTTWWPCPRNKNQQQGPRPFREHQFLPGEKFVQASWVQRHLRRTHFRRVRVYGCISSVGRWRSGDKSKWPFGESSRGEKRTGPALNPLKGSSARLPHCRNQCSSQAKTNSFVFNFLSLDSRVKMLYPREILPVG